MPDEKRCSDKGRRSEMLSICVSRSDKKDLPPERRRSILNAEQEDGHSRGRQGQFIPGFRPIIHPKPSANRCSYVRLYDERDLQHNRASPAFSTYSDELNMCSYDERREPREELDRRKNIEHEYSLLQGPRSSCNHRPPAHEDSNVYPRRFSPRDNKRIRFEQCNVSRRYFQDRNQVESSMKRDVAPAQREFKPPAMRKYSPTYQSPELIEELKRNDKMRSIREREGRRRGQFCTTHWPRGKDDSRFFNLKYQRTRQPSMTRKFPKLARSRFCEEKRTLPYQETGAFRSMIREFQRRTASRRAVEKVPLISICRDADNTKEIRQLFPPATRCRRKANAISALRQQIFHVFQEKKKGDEIDERRLGAEKVGATKGGYRIDPEFLSRSSSPCGCARQADRSASLPSTDETTDNNERVG
ncbi:hypothetical protein KM043_008788 [Ampulex compressa]|nr:hypothetical protein KM043_008788 [Ampulex compressa]